MSLICIVDDNVDLCQSLQTALESERYTVQIFHTCGEALVTLRSSTVLPAIIILDLMMPGMTGWDFLHEKKSEPIIRDIPVIVTTAVNKPRSHASLDTVGLLISKPYTVREILMAIRRTRSTYPPPRLIL
jgi:CheY-like chemotaxis protein